MALYEHVFDLTDIATGLTNGDHGGLTYTSSGVRYLRGQSVTEDGLDLSDELYISDEEHRRMERSEVIPGDVLFTIAGSIGNACVVSRLSRANINQAIVRIRPSNAVMPQYLADFLNSEYGKFQSTRLANGGVQLNINFSEVGGIRVAVPPPEKQRRLVETLEAAREARRAKLAEADALLAGMDACLLATLGLALPVADDHRSFALALGALREQSRLGPDYFHPERMLAIRAIQAAAARMDCSKLSSVVTFVRDQIKTPSENYIGLVGVQSQTGELSGVEEEVEGTCFTFERGDVLFARLRPYLNKVWCADANGCCSPEFHVLRVIDEKALQPEYLAAVLRSSLVLAQTRHMMTGNTHPLLANDDVINLVVPIPDLKMQQAIAAEIRRRRERARTLHADAEQGWAEAKRWFEEQLLGPAN